MLYIHSLTWVLLTCLETFILFSLETGDVSCASLSLTKKPGSSQFVANGELSVALFDPSEGYFETSFTVLVPHHNTDLGINVLRLHPASSRESYPLLEWLGSILFLYCV